MGYAPRLSQPAVYKLRCTTLAIHTTPMRLPPSRTLRRRHRLPHPIFRRAPRDGTVGLRNPASCEPVRVRGDQVFGERSRATTDDTTSSSDDEFPDPDFFPDMSNLLGNLNMGENLNAAGAAAAATAAAAAPATPYVILSFLYEIMLELFAVRTSLDLICSSSVLVRMTSLICVNYVMFYLLFFWIKSHSNLLIFSTESLANI